MVVIFSKVLQDFPFFFGDVGEYGFGFGCEFFEEILFPEVVFCNLLTDMFSASDVVYYGEQDVSALVSGLPERLLTHLSFSLSSSGSMEAVVSNTFFSFSDLVGSNSFTGIFIWVEDESLNFMKETFVIDGIFYISYT